MMVYGLKRFNQNNANEDNTWYICFLKCQVFGRIPRVRLKDLRKIQYELIGLFMAYFD